MDNKAFRGIFPVLQTPLTEDGQLDFDSMKREVNFCIQAGTHGLVYPVLGGEFQFLSREERQKMVEVVISEANNRVPVVTGVADVNKDGAVDHARHAAKTGANAVIALPPSNAGGKKDEIREYYEAIAQGVKPIPVFIQHTHGDMDVAMLLYLLEIENIQYIKEEMHPSAHNISALLEKVGNSCPGVFGGAHGRWMLSELHRGASGFMPAAEMTDIHVQIWDAYQSGDESGARDIFNQLLPLMNLITILGLKVCKEVLVMRGVLKSAKMRMPGALSLDEEDKRELGIIVDELRPIFRV